MAAVFGVRKFGINNIRALLYQPSKILAMAHLRLMTDGKSEPGKPTSDQQSLKKSTKEDTASYKVPEYYSYDKDSFADLEVEMSQAGCRQSQPDPRIPYYHHYPWEKKST